MHTLPAPATKCRGNGQATLFGQCNILFSSMGSRLGAHVVRGKFGADVFQILLCLGVEVSASMKTTWSAGPTLTPVTAARACKSRRPFEVFVLLTMHDAASLMRKLL